MKYTKKLAIIAVCFGLTGCVAASNKQVHFICSNSAVPSDFEKQITDIAQTHQFFPAPRQESGLLFYSKLKSSPNLYALINPSHPSDEVVLGISILRVPGSEDKLSPEILSVFDIIVHEVHAQILSGCILEKEH